MGRRRWPLLGIGTLGLLLLLMANAMLFFASVRRIVRNQSWVEHTQDVRLQLEEIQRQITDAETGQRGYLYTGETLYLDPYKSATQHLPGELDRIEASISDNPNQLQRLSELKDLTRQKLTELGSTIALRDAGRQEDARKAVLGGSGRSLMESIRRVLGEMRSEEQRLEASRANESQLSIRRSILALIFATLIAIIGLAVFAEALRREIRATDRESARVQEFRVRYETTLRSIGDAVISTDTSGKIVFLNSVAEAATGYRLDEATGRPVVEVFAIFNEQTGQATENPVDIVLRKGRVVGLANHTVLKRRDGSIIPIRDSAAPIRDADGNLKGVVLVFSDASDDKKREEGMRRAEKLAAAGRMAATIAHEINNPLEALGNLLFLIQKENGLSANSKSYLAMAERELNRVAGVARQTLGFYRDTSAPSSVSLPDLLEECVHIFQPKLTAKGIEVVRDYAPVTITGNSGELRQVFSNLISNAIDAIRSSGAIRLTVRPREGGAEVEVRDTGTGISPETMQKIFEPFFTTKQDIGTGLGLWVSRTIVENHGGEIHAATDKTGTGFTVSLPSHQLQGA